MRRFVLATLMLLLSVVPARAADAVSKGLKLDGGFQELLISVPDLEAAVAFYQRVAGWRVLYRGAVQPEMLSAWKLPDSAKGTEAVLQNPGDPSGFVRLIKFRGVSQDEVRPSAQIWDAGGLAGFDVQARDVWQKYGQFRQAGWHAYSLPVQHQLAGITSIRAFMQGPADEVVSVLQRLDPPLTNFPNLKELSYAFNAFETVKDFDATLAFYTDKLGFKVFTKDEGLAAPAGRNVYGLPYNLVNNVYRRVASVHPRGDNPKDGHAGAVTITAYYGVQGDDFSPHAHPPNLGLIAVRFPVSDAEGHAAALRAKGVALEYETTDVGMLPYGPVHMFAVRDPNGALLEFFEPADKPQ